ncbi:MAG: site-specific integrase [Alphaproteobacteria bacterium]|nr:site-specific integrase [Alphaproteobacteria bacterium]
MSARPNRHFELPGALHETTRGQIMNVVAGLSRTPSERQHAFVAIRTMMNWCVEAGLIESSPVPRIRQQTTSRERVLSDEELAAVYRRALETPYPYGSIIQLLVLTGQRRGEIAGLRRSWIEGDVLTFPAGFTKNKKEHRLPLPPMARRVIDAVPDTGDLLFPARGRVERPFNGWGKCKERFDAGLSFSDYTLHDLRRTFSSNVARLRVPIHVTEKILNHASGTIGGIAAVYNRHSYFAEMKEALLSHDEFIRNVFQADSALSSL